MRAIIDVYKRQPIDVYPLLRPFALGLCIMFFPTFVLGTINTVLSPVVKGCNPVSYTHLDVYKRQVYNKFSSGDPDTSKTAASWFGACIFLIVAATILRSFFL